MWDDIPPEWFILYFTDDDDDVSKTINTQRAGLRKSNHNVPSLIPLPLSVIRFSRHSWRTERNSGIPAKVFHSHKAQRNSDVEPSPLAFKTSTSDSECIILLCARCFTAVCQYCSCQDDRWQAVPPALTLQSQPGHSGRSACVAVSGENTLNPVWLVTCQQSTIRRCDSSWRISKLINVFTHTQLKVFARIAVHLLSAWQSLENSLSINACSVRKWESRRERKGSEWKKMKGRHSLRVCVWIQCIYCMSVCVRININRLVCCWSRCEVRL